MHTREEIVGAARIYGKDGTFNTSPPFELGDNAIIAPMEHGYFVGATIYVSKKNVNKICKCG